MLEAGFEYDYMKHDGWFAGKNEYGGKITLDYYGFNIMYMSYMLFDNGKEIPVAEKSNELKDEEPDASAEYKEDSLSNENIETNNATVDEQEPSSDEETEDPFDLLIAETELRNMCVNQKISDVYDYIQQSGYTATYTADKSNADFTESVRTDEETRESFYIIDIIEINSSTKTIEFKITSAYNYDLVQKSELDAVDAWVETEMYGKSQYTKFKLHYLTGKISESLEAENTWYLLAECDVNGEKGYYCESRVTGTPENPEIIYFNVYKK